MHIPFLSLLLPFCEPFINQTSSISLFIHLTLFNHLSNHLSIHPFYLFIHSFNPPLFHLSIYLPVHSSPSTSPIHPFYILSFHCAVSTETNITFGRATIIIYLIEVRYHYYPSIPPYFHSVL